MFSVVIILLACADPATQVAAQANPPPRLSEKWLEGYHPQILEPGFAPLLVASYPPEEVLRRSGPIPDNIDADAFLHNGAWIVDKQYHVLGFFEKGQTLPRPFEDWKIVELGSRSGSGSAVIFTNKKTNAEFEIDTLVWPWPDEWPKGKLRPARVRQVTGPSTQPIIRPAFIPPEVRFRLKYLPGDIPRDAEPTYRVPYPGFAVVQAFMDKDPAQCRVWFIDQGYFMLTRPGEVGAGRQKLPGERHGGELLPEPFQSWRVVGAVTPLSNPRDEKPVVIVRNETTGEVLEMYRFRYFKTALNGVDIGPAPRPIQVRKPDASQPTTRP